MPVRIATFNIRGALGMDGRRDPGRIADIVRALDADMVCLQEVYRRLPGHWEDEAAVIARGQGMRSVFLPTIGLSQCGFGLAILSRPPLSRIRRLMLPSLRERRGLLCVDVASDGGPVTVACVHLGLDGSERLKHARAIAEFTASMRPLVLAGDFNEGPDGDSVRYLTGACGLLDPAADTEAPTYPSDHPTARIDLILHSPDLRALSLTVVPTQSSDHRPVVADFETARSAS